MEKIIKKKESITYICLILSFVMSYCSSRSDRVQPLNDGINQMCDQIAKTLWEGNRKRIAILDFTDFKGRKIDFGKYLSEKLIFSMYKIKGIEVIERNQLQKVLKTLKYQQSGLVDAATMKKIERLAGANALLLGTVTDMGKSLDVNGRIVDTENGKIVAVMSVPLAKDEKVASFFEQDNKSTVKNTKKAIYLSDINPLTVKNIHGGLQRDKVYWQSEIWIDGKYFQKGLGTHAPQNGKGTIEYRVPGSYKRFKSTIGLARQDGSEDIKHIGSVRFYVYVNNKRVYGSNIIRAGKSIDITIRVKGGDKLKLEIDNGGDSYHADHLVWGNARFTME